MMIAVAVAASLVTYAWVMGYLGFTTAKVGKAIQIQSIAKSGTNLLVYVQNVGSGSVVIPAPDGGIYVNGIQQNAGDPQTLGEGKTAVCTVTGYFTGSGPWTIKVRAVTGDGTFTEATVTIPS
jgi:hypothetical protein